MIQSGTLYCSVASAAMVGATGLALESANRLTGISIVGWTLPFGWGSALAAISVLILLESIDWFLRRKRGE